MSLRLAAVTPDFFASPNKSCNPQEPPIRPETVKKRSPERIFPAKLLPNPPIMLTLRADAFRRHFVALRKLAETFRRHFVALRRLAETLRRHFVTLRRLAEPLRRHFRGVRHREETYL
ncbi:MULTISPECIES: hypothetical protein [Bacteroidaceae]|uniref:hypothetical protein n=1 Tax=Bacteroidaceae TaxID=815 RepID=UPI00111F1FD6|nr:MULTISPECIES: hypothetical protein [Bacteroides]MBM6945012.1 hypothetical protein [Bacteroides gallinaceum]